MPASPPTPLIYRSETWWEPLKPIDKRLESTKPQKLESQGLINLTRIPYFQCGHHKGHKLVLHQMSKDTLKMQLDLS